MVRALFVADLNGDAVGTFHQVFSEVRSSSRPRQLMYDAARLRQF